MSNQIHLAPSRAGGSGEKKQSKTTWQTSRLLTDTAVRNSSSMRVKLNTFAFFIKTIYMPTLKRYQLRAPSYISAKAYHLCKNARPNLMHKLIKVPLYHLRLLIGTSPLRTSLPWLINKISTRSSWSIFCCNPTPLQHPPHPECTVHKQINKCDATICEMKHAVK